MRGVGRELSMEAADAQSQDVVTRRFSPSGAVVALTREPVPQEGEPFVALLPQWLQGCFFFVDDVASYEVTRHRHDAQPDARALPA